jgi:hypothetical protein
MRSTVGVGSGIAGLGFGRIVVGEKGKRASASEDCYRSIATQEIDLEGG